MNSQHSAMHAGEGAIGDDALESVERMLLEAIEELTRKGIAVSAPRLSERQSQQIDHCKSSSELLFSYSCCIEQVRSENQELKRSPNNTQGNRSDDVLDIEERTMLEGMRATSSKLFWLRMLAALLSLISFSVMATVPQALNRNGVFHPGRVNKYYSDNFVT